MQVFADLHVHSRFSMASSHSMMPGPLLSACRTKGIGVLGSGDALHPGWREAWAACRDSCEEILVVPTTEVEDLHRVHHLIMMEDFDSCALLQQNFAPHSRDLATTGRPHIRLPGEEIARIVHEQGGLVGPAHAFTPWTSLYAAYDRVADCYGSERIDFLELGLSADSSYGASITDLYHIPFLTNSDAHSPDPVKIGREFNEISLSGFSVRAVLDSIREGGITMNAGLFPEQGKYNRTACTRCYRQFPLPEAVALRWKCPDDRGRIKKGVSDRASELSDGQPGQRPPYLHIIPLGEIIRSVLGTSSPGTRRCRDLYAGFVTAFGDEITVLTAVPVRDLARVDAGVARAIDSFRNSRIVLSPGGGGRYGSFSLVGSPG